MITTLDRYIIKKVLFTFFFSIISVLSIVIVFDISEKLDDFLKANMSFWEIASSYYVGFAIFFGIMFFPLFTLLTIVMVTTKMNQRNEITAILSSGISFNRMLRPFFIAVAIIALLSFLINIYLYPDANSKRINWENQHTGYEAVMGKTNVEVQKGIVVSYKYYHLKDKDVVLGMWVDVFEEDSSGKQLLVKTIKADGGYQENPKEKEWNLKTVLIREYNGENEKMRRLATFDTILPFCMEDLAQRTNIVETMTIAELKEYRDIELSKGSKIVPFIEIEMYRRYSNPLSLLIIALLGICISISPARSKVGMTILIGISTVALYFVFNRFTTVAATNAGLDSFLAVWIPNFFLLFFAIYLYIRTPK